MNKKQIKSIDKKTIIKVADEIDSLKKIYLDYNNQNFSKQEIIDLLSIGIIKRGKNHGAEVGVYISKCGESDMNDIAILVSSLSPSGIPRKSDTTSLKVFWRCLYQCYYKRGALLFPNKINWLIDNNFIVLNENQ